MARSERCFRRPSGGKSTPATRGGQGKGTGTGAKSSGKTGQSSAASGNRSAKAKPGSVNYASAGAGNSSHLNGERFRLAAGFEAVHLPFKGAPEAMTEVLAGRADFYFAPLVNALPLLKDGQLQALAVSGSARASTLPDVPTTVEAGYPNSEYNFWAGIFLPAKTPADVRARFYAEIAKALQTPAVREKLAGLGADPMALTSAEFDALVKREIETNTDLVKAAGIKVN